MYDKAKRWKAGSAEGDVWEKPMCWDVGEAGDVELDQAKSWKDGPAEDDMRYTGMDM